MKSRTINDFTMNDVHSLFDSDILHRGEEYCDEGCVTFIGPSDARTIKAIVQGNRQYDVSISFDDEDEILCECTCPCDFNCKHAAATMLKWLSIKKNHKNLHGSAHSSKASLDQILKTKSKEELIELFTEIIKKRPEFISLLYVDQQKITSTVKRLFAHFWEEGEVHELIGNLDTILEGIRRNSKVWDKSLLNEIHTCSTIMIEKIENVQDEGQFTIFLEDWFQVYGEIFATIQPTIVDKETFIQHIIAWMNADDYGYDNCFEKALIGMCTCEEDIKLIRNHLAAEEAKYPEDSHYYQQFYLQLYEKVGLTEPYLEIAKQSGLFATAVKKLIGLGKYDEALKICENNNRDNDIQLDLLRIDLLKKINRRNDAAQALFELLEKTGHYDYYQKLKRESPKEQWRSYLERLILDTKKKHRYELLSRIYYAEKDYRNAYEYAKDLRDFGYLEVLAGKLTTTHSELACQLYRQLCFDWISQGAGWPYKKAGKMLSAMKHLDKNGLFFKKTKEELIKTYRKKYSLIQIIERI